MTAPSPTPQDLPEEIAKAIEALRDAEHRHGGSYFSDSSNEARLERLAEQACEALTAAILSRLGEAEARREEALKDLRTAWLTHSAAVLFRDERNAALARVERLESALEPLWQRARAPGADRVPDDGTVTVFMKDCREALAALSEAPPQGEQ